MQNIDQYKTRLQAEKETLEKQLSELGIHNPTVPEDWIATPEDASRTEADENVVADRAEDWAERRAETGELETRYNNVVLALKKIEEGTYGICEVGGEEIGTDRLEANPAARTCKAHMEIESTNNN